MRFGTTSAQKKEDLQVSNLSTTHLERIPY